MKKPTQDSKSTLTGDDAIHQWTPYAVAGVIFVLALIVGILSKDILMILGSGLSAIAVFLIMRTAFPMPGSSQSTD
jgi:hypothetical protein